MKTMHGGDGQVARSESSKDRMPPSRYERRGNVSERHRERDNPQEGEKSETADSGIPENVASLQRYRGGGMESDDPRRVMLYRPGCRNLPAVQETVRSSRERM